MKLNIDFQHDPETGRPRSVITDDRGERMPCVRSVDVKYRYPKPSGEITTVLVELVVNGRDVTLGRPIAAEATSGTQAGQDGPTEGPAA
jgi:hypothetical protein